MAGRNSEKVLEAQRRGTWSKTRSSEKPTTWSKLGLGEGTSSKKEPGRRKYLTWSADLGRAREEKWERLDWSDWIWKKGEEPDWRRRKGKRKKKKKLGSGPMDWASPDWAEFRIAESGRFCDSAILDPIHHQTYFPDSSHGIGIGIGIGAPLRIVELYDFTIQIAIPTTMIKIIFSMQFDWRNIPLDALQGKEIPELQGRGMSHHRNMS
ncbi:hypothetical protein CDL15_Pgr016548 [Punica granatum]|uniref:Uncharacterized protein n=1 Tax=Punica granatum TaxID=22663 RepID=A0A218WJU2_PUNGR|nr:hypothetical protein CDL15_Pgr016548 [Punica granatum]